VWTLKARLGLESFTPQCLAHTLWALPRLGQVAQNKSTEISPSISIRPDLELLEGLLIRCSSVCTALNLQSMRLYTSTLYFTVYPLLVLS
jgi:hypothetical protein